MGWHGNMVRVPSRDLHDAYAAEFHEPISGAGGCCVHIDPLEARVRPTSGPLIEDEVAWPHSADGDIIRQRRGHVPQKLMLVHTVAFYPDVSP